MTGPSYRIGERIAELAGESHAHFPSYLWAKMGELPWSPAEKLVAVRLCLRCWQDDRGTTTATYDMLADELGLSRRTLVSAVRTLQLAGALEVDRGRAHRGLQRPNRFTWKGPQG